MNLQDFLEKVMIFGLEYFKVFPGLYRGIVTRVDDPEKRGRIQALVPGAGQVQPANVWIKPTSAGAGTNRGMFWPPEKGDTVFVSFAQGRPSKPELYLGGWYGSPDQVSDVPGEFPYTNSVPQKRGFVTRMGHSIVFSDEKDNEYVRVTWHKADGGDAAQDLTQEVSATADREKGDFSFFELTKTGSIQMANKSGSYMFMDAEGKAISLVSEQGHAVTMTDDGVTIMDKLGNLIALDKGKLNIVVDGNVNLTAGTVNLSAGGVNLGSPAPMSVPLGELLLTWLTSHTHPTGVGPSGPPIVPPTPALLSKSIKVKP